MTPTKERLDVLKRRYPAATLWSAYTGVMVTLLFIYQVATHGHP